MSYNQDRKHEHWLKIGPKNIEERNTNKGESSPVAKPADWDRIEKEQRGENESVYRPWEAEGDGSLEKGKKGKRDE